ncbi:hypothetical protein [Natronorubrum halophilum]|uniref:hypothetical protein n=1 Tax=Natronorubrum halophilum TaxID=1702106 RepID=UPI0010C16372|nr:hypothetical protein [Natronorubrum halophilum]
MNAGIVGRVHGEFSDIDTDPFPLTRSENGEQLRSTVSVETVREHLGGDQILTGFAAEQVQSEAPSSTIDPDGNLIETGNEIQTHTDSTEFICDPGEFVLVENSKKEYAFDLIGRVTESAIERVNFDLDSFLDFHPDAQIWMGGFYNHSGSATTGVAYGDVLDDPNIGPIMEDSNKNQVGVVIENESEKIKMQITESGYVSVFQPSEFGPLSMARLIREELLEHAKPREEVN